MKTEELPKDSQEALAILTGKLEKALRTLNMKPVDFFRVCSQHRQQRKDDSAREVGLTVGIKVVSKEDIAGALHQLTKLDLTDEVLTSVMSVLAPGGEDRVTLVMMKQHLHRLTSISANKAEKGQQAGLEGSGAAANKVKSQLQKTNY